MAIRKEMADYLDNHPNTENAQVLRDLLASDNDLFARGDSSAHITASAWILNDEITHALLIEHGKYLTFCPPGGHVDPGETVMQACLREAMEEVGLVLLRLLGAKIFDVDIHRIPASVKKNEPEHWHIDVRYAVIADKNEKVKLNLEECRSYVWKALAEMLNGKDRSLSRLSGKTLALSL